MYRRSLIDFSLSLSLSTDPLPASRSLRVPPICSTSIISSSSFLSLLLFPTEHNSWRTLNGPRVARGAVAARRRLVAFSLGRRATSTSQPSTTPSTLVCFLLCYYYLLFSSDHIKKQCDIWNLLLRVWESDWRVFRFHFSFGDCLNTVARQQQR